MVGKDVHAILNKRRELTQNKCADEQRDLESSHKDINDTEDQPGRREGLDEHAEELTCQGNKNKLLPPKPERKKEKPWTRNKRKMQKSVRCTSSLTRQLNCAMLVLQQQVAPQQHYSAISDIHTLHSADITG